MQRKAGAHGVQCRRPRASPAALGGGGRGRPSASLRRLLRTHGTGATQHGREATCRCIGAGARATRVGGWVFEQKLTQCAAGRRAPCNTRSSWCGTRNRDMQCTGRRAVRGMVCADRMQQHTCRQPGHGMQAAGMQRSAGNVPAVAVTAGGVGALARPSLSLAAAAACAGLGAGAAGRACGRSRRRVSGALSRRPRSFADACVSLARCASETGQAPPRGWRAGLVYNLARPRPVLRSP